MILPASPTTRALTAVALALLACGTLAALEHAPAREVPGQPVDAVAFLDVRVLQRDDRGAWSVSGALHVIVAGDRITAVGPAATTPVPAGAARIQGGGTRILSPGLVDTHAHLAYEAGTWMGTFLVNGVTTVFNLRGGPAQLELRREVEEGRLAGPAILTSGPFTNQPAIATPADARSAVDAHIAAGYDMVKIHGNLTRDTYAELIAAGRRARIPVTGHIPRNLPARDALELDQDWIAHAEELMYTAFPRHDTTGVGALVAEIATRRIALSPTLRTFRNIARQWARPNAVDSALALPEASMLHAGIRRAWREDNPYTGRTEAGIAWSASAYAFQRHLVRAAAAAGVLLMTGTDTPLPLMFPGSSVIEEMQELVEAGVPRDVALDAATVAPARFLRERAPRADADFGEVRVGLRPRLVLLDEDPLESFQAYRRGVVGVLANGRWYDPAALTDLSSPIDVPGSTFLMHRAARFSGDEVAPRYESVVTRTTRRSP